MKELEKQQPVLEKRQLTPKQRKSAAISFGDRGEELAIVFLLKRGYTILERNLRFKTYEVDIIALDRKYQELVFIEVKRRKTAAFGHPVYIVTPKKVCAMNQVAHRYIQIHDFPFDYRFDTITIVKNKIEHFKNITCLT